MSIRQSADPPILSANQCLLSTIMSARLYSLASGTCLCIEWLDLGRYGCGGSLGGRVNCASWSASQRRRSIATVGSEAGTQNLTTAMSFSYHNLGFAVRTYIIRSTSRTDPFAIERRWF
jgi:hypothetical protein